MSYFRVQFQGYLEDEFDNADEAVEAFFEILDTVDSVSFTVEEWNEELQEWETV